jgi:hypothetical protein
MVTRTPRCCDDAGGGEMVRTDDGWLCVWCGRETTLAVEVSTPISGARFSMRGSTPVDLVPTRIPGQGRGTQR